MDQTIQELPLNQLRAFAALFQSGGVRPAARLLGIAHSAVSRHVSGLQQWLGVELIDDRRGQRVDFTPQGEALGKILVKCFQDMGQTVDALRERRSGNSVTIATAPSMAARWLLPRLPRLQDRLPWIEISVIVDQRPRVPDDLGADLNLRMGKGPWPEFRCDPLMDDALFPVVNRQQWEVEGCPSDLEYLRRIPLLHDRDPNTPWSLWRNEFGPANLDIRRGPRFTSSDVLLRAAAEGIGAALARGRLAAEDIKSGVLVRPFGEAAVVLNDAYWIVRPRLTPTRSAIDAVINWLIDEAKAP
jgi:LysR family glycine cleavage system transcriptional activator